MTTADDMKGLERFVSTTETLVHDLERQNFMLADNLREARETVFKLRVFVLKKCAEAGKDITEWNKELNAGPRDRPMAVLQHVSRGVALKEHILMRVAFNQVLAYIHNVVGNIQAVGTLHPGYNQEDINTQSGGSDSDDDSSGEGNFKKRKFR